MPALDQLTSADFAACLSQPFTIRLEGVEPIALELARVAELGAATSAGPQSRRPFSLLFLGPASRTYLLQRTYRLEHAALGALEIFLVPIGPEGGRMRYEAIFT